MPAVAVPAIISIAGMAASAIGKHRAASAAKKAAEAKRNSLQSVIDFNYNADLEAQRQNMGNFQQMFASASQPQSESTVSNEETTQDTTRSMDFGPEGNAAKADVLQAARNAPWEVNNLLAEQQAAANRAISGAERAQGAQIGNLAASRGVDPRLMKLGANQAFNAQRLDADLQSKQQAYANRVGAFGNIAQVLKGLYQTDIEKSKGTRKGRSTTTGGPNYAAMLGAIQAQAPVHKEFADVQGA